jgi:SAM-dependent methyltransferase
MSAAPQATTAERYASMQKAFYEQKATRFSPEAVVGFYGFHQNFPYETHLFHAYGDIRRPIFTDIKSRRAFDFGCGEGRMVRRLQPYFEKVDGCDISATMIDTARRRTEGSDFWVTDGLGAGDAPSDFYDFCYNTISLQHICVFETRDLILKDLCRILKPDGKMTLQYIYSRNYPALPVTPVKLVSPDQGVQLFKVDKQHARWFDNKTDAQSTNGGCDVVIGPSDLPVVETYFRRYFENVDIWLHDYSIGRGGLGEKRILPDTHPNSLNSDNAHPTHFVFIHCSGKKI